VGAPPAAPGAFTPEPFMLAGPRCG
jgi:hypothetical protein